MILTAELSSQGGREYNEDSVGIKERGQDACVIVADGLGGHGGGKTASTIAVDGISTAWQNTAKISEEWMLSVYTKVNADILSMQTEACQMKTTCVSLFIEQEKAWWVHLGDSRLYHFVDGILESQTVDHSVSQMAVLSGEITLSQIRFHEDRNRVLRALGMEEPQPTYGQADLSDGRFHAFLLCTDGFWEYVLEDEMELDLAKVEQPEDWIRIMETRLQKKVNGKNDNYSAAALFFQSDRM